MSASYLDIDRIYSARRGGFELQYWLPIGILATSLNIPIGGFELRYRFPIGILVIFLKYTARLGGFELYYF